MTKKEAFIKAAIAIECELIKTNECRTDADIDDCHVHASAILAACLLCDAMESAEEDVFDKNE